MNQQHKSQALEMFPYGLYVVGVGKGETIGAYTANWVCQASFEPALVMLGVRRGARHHELIEKDRVLTVNILASDQKKIAATFMRWLEPQGGHFGSIAYTTGVTGAPILDDAPAYLECEVNEIVAGGDHDVVIARVIEAGHRRDASPLLLSDTGWTYGG